MSSGFYLGTLKPLGGGRRWRGDSCRYQHSLGLVMMRSEYNVLRNAEKAAQSLTASSPAVHPEAQRPREGKLFAEGYTANKPLRGGIKI